MFSTSYFRYLGCQCLLLLLMLLPMLSVAAPSELILDNHKAELQTPLSLLNYAEILVDPSGQLTLPELLNKDADFVDSGVVNGELDLNLTQSAYWFRVTLNNQSDKENWYFTLSGSLSRKLDVYLSPREGDLSFVQQPLLPHSRSLQYLVPLKGNSRYWLYFRIKDRGAALIIRPQLRSPKQMLLDIMLMYPLYSFVIGGLLTLALYNLLYFVYLRDRSFLALSIFIFGFVLEMGNHSGVWFYFSSLRQILSGMGSAFGLLAIAACISMANNWLELSRYLPRLYPIIRAIFWVSLALIPIQWWLGYGTAFAGLVGLLLLVLLLATTIVRYQQGFRFSFMLLVAISLVFVAVIPTLLRGAGLIGDVPVLTDGMYFILLLALVMLSLTQAEQVRTKSEHAERIEATNEAKDQFLTTMSHELRTPMNAVISAGRLLDRTTLCGEQREYVKRLNTSSDHMLALINDILDLARLDSRMRRVVS